MGKITIVIPYSSIEEIVQEIIREQDDRNWDFEIIKNTGVRFIGERDLNTDVIIARGVTAAALKRKLTNTPVVDLPVSGYDFMSAVKKCVSNFNERIIGIVGSYDMIYGATSIEEIMDVKLCAVAVQDEDDAEPSIANLKRNGINTIIGGVMSCEIAERLGLNSVFIESGREAVFRALREAKRVAKVRRQEQERAGRLQAILNYTDEGIISVDCNGIINLMNVSAAKIAGLPANSTGIEIKNILPQMKLDKTISSGKAELGEIEYIGEQQVAVNRVPVEVEREIVGAVATFRPVAAIQELEGKIRQKIHHRGHVAKLNFEDIIGKSQALQVTIATAREYSKVDSNVLIYGETGAGKEVFAQSMHNASKRSHGPFVALNCAALPESLLESELFGYAEGAFTGAARKGKMGLFELAHRGTIFLDEISEISPNLQGRLLRVLQEREIMRLGDDRVIPIDVRVIAATNRNLLELVKEDRFREDLYYRLDILELAIPPLRERNGDILLLMNHFLSMYSKKCGKSAGILTDAANNELANYYWPGNIRQLRNIAERLVVLVKESVIHARDIQSILPSRQQEVVGKKERSKSDMQTAALRKALEEAHYHYGKAAAILGISRTTLWRRLKQEGIVVRE